MFRTGKPLSAFNLNDEQMLEVKKVVLESRNPDWAFHGLLDLPNLLEEERKELLTFLSEYVVAAKDYKLAYLIHSEIKPLPKEIDGVMISVMSRHTVEQWVLHGKV